MQYLVKRNGIYYFRVAIPLYLRAYFDNKTEYITSFLTKRFDTAKNRAKIYSIIFNAIKKAWKMNLSSELIEHLVLLLLKAKEAKSIKEHDMLGRYINLDGLLSLNLFLKQSLKEDSLPSVISKEVDEICKKLSCTDPQTKKLLGKRVLEATIDNINHISYKMCKNQKLLNDEQQAFVPLGKKDKSVNLDDGTKDEIAKGIKEASIDSYQDDIEALKKQDLVLPFTKKSLKNSVCELRDAINELAKQKGALTQNDILRIFGCELSPDGDNELSDDLKFGYGNLDDPTFGGQVKLYKADKYEDKGIVLSDIETKDLALNDTSDVSGMTFNEAINFFQKLFSNRAKSFISQLDSTAKNESKADMLTLKSAFENYVSNTSISNNWSDSTFGLVRHVGRLMSMKFGDELDIKKIKRDDLLNFRNVLLQLPTKLSQNSLYKDKSLDEIITLAKDRPKISKSTIKKYIVRVSEFFKYCYDSDYIDKNPAIDLQININQDDVTNKNPYEDSDVNALLDIVSKIRSSGDTKSQRISKDELFFVTHIAAYSGMRLNEIIQLNTDDIVEKYNIACFSLNTKIDVKTGKSKTLKTRNSVRIVPIHSKLSSIGLFEFIESKKKLVKQSGKAVRLFNCDNKDFSEYFRKKINTQVIKDGDKTRTFHSFRHTFINKLIQSGQRVEHIAALVGHEQQYKITMNTYGEPVTPKILKDLVEEVNFYQGREG
ncbi:tyrosine-type recombinase/integrase [Campylobacter concisus]|uniref:tyrosine-type recombinase/integrase n=1 Tax=Campylobacter concisus TaxID=199 RepID=UPI000D3AF82F|nr:tyrosine-type recombinase/integrase [Campylobacter concisus]